MLKIHFHQVLGEWKFWRVSRMWWGSDLCSKMQIFIRLRAIVTSRLSSNMKPEFHLKINSLYLSMLKGHLVAMDKSLPCVLSSSHLYCWCPSVARCTFRVLDKQTDPIKWCFYSESDTLRALWTDTVFQRWLKTQTCLSWTNVSASEHDRTERLRRFCGFMQDQRKAVELWGKWRAPLFV